MVGPSTHELWVGLGWEAKHPPRSFAILCNVSDSVLGVLAEGSIPADLDDDTLLSLTRLMALSGELCNAVYVAYLFLHRKKIPRGWIMHLGCKMKYMKKRENGG